MRISDWSSDVCSSDLRALSVEGRMTVCNMAIEAGARSGMVAVDDKTIEYFRGRPYAPVGVLWDQAVKHWRHLHTDPGAAFAPIVAIDARPVAPQVDRKSVVEGKRGSVRVNIGG